MTYTINPNAENVWIRDNEDTMDLSPITDASSVYLENGRTLEQELGEGSMISNVATVDSAMSKVIDGTLDGAYESCVFKGKSLVNISQFEKLFEATPSVLNTNSVIWYGNTSKLYVNLFMFKPNTKYIVKIGNGTPSRFKGIYISGLNMSNPNGYYTEHNSVFTTPSTIPTEANMYIKGVEGEVITKAEYSKCQISIIEYQEGMENWDIPYFEGMCDVKSYKTLENLFTNPIDTVGKNLTTTIHTDHINLSLPTVVNVTYLLTFKVSNLNIDGNSSGIQLLVRGNTTENGYSFTNLEGTRVLNNGTIKLLLTNKTLQFTSLLIGVSASANQNSPSFTISETMLIPYQQGMENWDIPYFEGTVNIQRPMVTNVGKNLFDKNTVIQGHYNGSDIFYNDSKFITYEKPISVIPDTEYIFSNNIQTKYGRVNFYDKNMKILSAITDLNLSPFTTPSGCYFIRISTYRNTGITPSDIEWSQLETGRIATTYEPYKSNILSCNSEVVLRSLPNGVCDTLDLMTGEYVQRIGEVVLDGSEDESYSELSVNENSYTVWTHFPIPAKAFGKTINNKCFINEWWEKESNSCGIDHNGSLIVTIKKELLSTTSTEALKKYLKQNPITIQYELATPITTTVKSSGIPFAYENGHVILESGSEEQSLLPTLKYSTVVNRTGQVESVTKTIVKQETQITELEKMLVQGIIGMDYNNTLLTLNLEIDEVI